MRCLWWASYPTLPTLDILCCVLCLCQIVCVWGGGAHMPMHASSLVVFMSVCVFPPHPTPTSVSLRCDTCMNVFVLVVF